MQRRSGNVVKNEEISLENIIRMRAVRSSHSRTIGIEFVDEPTERVCSLTPLTSPLIWVVADPNEGVRGS